MPGGPVVTSGGLAAAPQSRFSGIAMTAFSAFGGILYGYDTGIISGIIAMDNWLQTFGEATGDPTTPYAITSSQQSLVVSILSVGTFFGSLFGAPAADFLGRKWGMIFSCLVFSVGVAMQTASTALPLFIVGRVFAGLGVGLVSTLAPMYQSECSPKWIRGAVVALYQWAITIGILLATVINNAVQGRQDHSSYQIAISVQFIWAVVLAGGMFFLPESPRWLVKRGNDEQAAVSLSRLLSVPTTDPDLLAELEEIRINLEHEKSLGESSYLDCFKPSTNRIALRTWTGILIQAWQQLTGINFIFYYGTAFFKNAGIKNPFLISIATAIVNVFMTLPGIYGVERFGRRNLLLIGAAGMCVCEYIVAIVGVTISIENVTGQKALIAFVCIYIAFFASTWGPIAWVIVGEIFPLNVRAKAMSMSVASNWLWNFGIGFATPYLVNSDPGDANLQSKVFFIWGSTCLGCFIFTYFFIPETKGLSLEQVDLMYERVSPMRSHVFRAQLQAGEISLIQAQKGEHVDANDEKEPV